MKKIVLVLIVGFAVIFGGCNKKLVSTQYTIGCRGYQYIPIQESEWNELQSYFINNVEYDKLVTFESISLAANDAKARQLLNEELEKIDTTYVCSLLHGSDYFDYGIATLNANGSYRNIKVIRFSENGTQDLTAH
jgi:hypothetical protein